jgi:hypothetical protein
MNFKEWLEINETRYVGLRGELPEADAKKVEIGIGDIAELIPEKKLKGTQGGSIGRVVAKRAFEIEVEDLTEPGKKIIVPVTNFYDKEELKGRTLLPSEERELRILGGKKLWVILTPRQHKKFRKAFEPKKLPEIVPSAPTEKPSEFLRTMFGKKEQEPSQSTPLSGIFSKTSGESQPLARHINKRKSIFGEPQIS